MNHHNPLFRFAFDRSVIFTSERCFKHLSKGVSFNIVLCLPKENTEDSCPISIESTEPVKIAPILTVDMNQSLLESKSIFKSKSAVPNIAVFKTPNFHTAACLSESETFVCSMMKLDGLITAHDMTQKAHTTYSQA